MALEAGGVCPVTLVLPESRSPLSECRRAMCRQTRAGAARRQPSCSDLDRRRTRRSPRRIVDAAGSSLDRGRFHAAHRRAMQGNDVPTSGAGWKQDRLASRAEPPLVAQADVERRITLEHHSAPAALAGRQLLLIIRVDDGTTRDIGERERRRVSSHEYSSGKGSQRASGLWREVITVLQTRRPQQVVGVSSYHRPTPPRSAKAVVRSLFGFAPFAGACPGRAGYESLPTVLPGRLPSWRLGVGDQVAVDGRPSSCQRQPSR